MVSGNYRCNGQIFRQPDTMLWDTGCSKTLVNAALVPPKAYLGGKQVKILWGDGRSSEVPLATACFDCECVKGEIK